MGGMLAVPGEADIGAPALRRLVASAVTEETIGGYAAIWDAVPGSDLGRTAARAGDPGGRVAAARAVITSMSPVMYQGDDFSLGILSERLGVHFVILRSDGTFQGGMPDIPGKSRIMLLSFDDAAASGVEGATGHYDLVAHRGRGVFTPKTLPSALYALAKQEGITFEPRAREANDAGGGEAPGAVGNPSGEPAAEDGVPGGSPALEQGEFVAFPMILSEPQSGEECDRAMADSILTILARMEALGAPELWQQYMLDLVTGSAVVNLGARRDPLPVISVDASVYDWLDDDKENPLGLHIGDVATPDEAAALVRGLLAAHERDTGPIGRVQVRIGEGELVGIHDIDRGLS